MAFDYSYLGDISTLGQVYTHKPVTLISTRLMLLLSSGWLVFDVMSVTESNKNVKSMVSDTIPLFQLGQSNLIVAHTMEQLYDTS